MKFGRYIQDILLAGSDAMNSNVQITMASLVLGRHAHSCTLCDLPFLVPMEFGASLQSRLPVQSEIETHFQR